MNWGGGGGGGASLVKRCDYGVLTMSDWISVQDRLPEYGVPVLIVYHGVVQYIAYARDIGEWRSADTNESDAMPESFVTHWMSLPEPPK
jgi:hypothetical protein